MVSWEAPAETVAQKSPHTGSSSPAQTSPKPKHTDYVSTKVYKMNNGPRNQRTGEHDLDRDNDGIACER